MRALSGHCHGSSDFVRKPNQPVNNSKAVYLLNVLDLKLTEHFQTQMVCPSAGAQATSGSF